MSREFCFSIKFPFICILILINKSFNLFMGHSCKKLVHKNLWLTINAKIDVQSRHIFDNMRTIAARSAREIAMAATPNGRANRIA